MRKRALYAILGRASLHCRFSRTLCILVWTGALFVLWCLLWFTADNLLNLPRGARCFCLCFSLLAGAGLLLFLILRYGVKRDNPRRIAVYLEQRYGITDNRLINAVCFDQAPDIPDFIRNAVEEEAVATCRNLSFRRIWREAHFRPALILLSLSLAVLLIYAIPFGSHAGNALKRFLDPSTSLMPLDATQFEVSPGDFTLAEGERCLISVKAGKFGRSPRRLDILVKGRGKPILYPMRAAGEEFVFELSPRTGVTRYALKSGNDRSRWYTLTVLPRPRADALRLRLTPPAYTRLPERTLSPDARSLAVPRDSRLHVDARGIREPGIAFYLGESPGPSSNAFTRVLSENLALSMDVTDRKGFVHSRVWACDFLTVEDAPPEVEIRNGEMNIEAKAGSRLQVRVALSDDYGLRAWELFTRREGEEIVLERYTFREEATNRMEIGHLTLSGKLFVPHTSYKIWARVYDNRPHSQTGLSPLPISLHILDPLEHFNDRGDSPYVTLFTTLTSIMERQKSTRDWLAPQVGTGGRHGVRAELMSRQGEIARGMASAAAQARELLASKRIPERISTLIQEANTHISLPLMKRVRDLRGNFDERGMKKVEINAILLEQSRLVTALRQILGGVDRERDREVEKRQALAKEEQEQVLTRKVEEIKDQVEKFREDQRRALADLEAIDKKAPEDWTEEEEALLGNLSTQAQEWAKFFKAAFNDLSKLENQDFSNSSMADEFVEIYEELQKSGEALEKKHVEIATLNESLMGEQAESITANLERWLADAKDSTAFVGEEAGVSPDVPLQDLPEELTDIIGELIDSVEDRADVEDSSNSSLSAFDQGIGWSVSDGNMDSMAARGITGNILPNNNEVGGRSGEGRSGKSSGQFVENEAFGKGGRDTPTRLVQSPYEKGTVKDHSRESQGGATGGGKQSGVGGEGLRGVTPDQKRDIDERMAGPQAELKQRAEALVRELTVRNLPTGDLEDALNKMELIQKYASRGAGLQVRQMRGEVVARLRDARSTLAGEGKRSSFERRTLRKRTLWGGGIREGDEATPEGYEACVEAYFRRLASPETEEE